MLVGYGRISSRDQNTDLQMRALKATGCERIFTEKASGARRDRPQLAAALEFMQPGDTLVVWKLDRFARSLKQLIETVERLDAQDIRFRSLTENIDTETAGGRVIYHLFGALADFERSIIHDRLIAGLAAARAKGRVGGRPRALKDNDLAAARALLADHSIPVGEVARRLDISPATLYRHFPGGRGAIEARHG